MHNPQPLPIKNNHPTITSKPRTTTHNHCQKSKLAKNHHTNHHQHSHTTTDPRNPATMKSNQTATTKPRETHEIQPHHKTYETQPLAMLLSSMKAVSVELGSTIKLGLTMELGLMVRWRIRLLSVGWAVRWRTGQDGSTAWDDDMSDENEDRRWRITSWRVQRELRVSTGGESRVGEKKKTNNIWNGWRIKKFFFFFNSQL